MNSKIRIRLVVPFMLIVCAIFSLQNIYSQGVSLTSEVKYKQGFKHFDYVNPNAPKRGEVTLGQIGTFDTLNPFLLKGEADVAMHRYVFQPLMENSLDEAITKYPSIAKSITLAKDKLSMIIDIDQRARFSDGSAITADDVVFSINLFLSDKVEVFYNRYYTDIKKVTKLSKYKVKVDFKKVNPELHLIIVEINILPKKMYSKGDFKKDFNLKAIGSGPYIVDSYKIGRSITYKRNPNFWAKDHPSFKGIYNFNKVKIIYYGDPTAHLEGFKKGDYDYSYITSSKVWAKDLNGKKFTKLNWIKKNLWQHSLNQGVQGFTFNLRRKKFQNIKLRQAIALAFDFEWSNKNLFYGQYTASKSFFENSELAARGLPSSSELEFLNKYKQDLPKEVFTKKMGWIEDVAPARSRLKMAHKLLKSAGYVYKSGKLMDKGKPLVIEMVLRGTLFSRIVEPFAKNLRKLGIELKVVIKETTVWVKTLEQRNFDMIVNSIGQSESPGNEQLGYFGSKSASIDGSRNYSGVHSKAIDAIIAKIITANNRTDLVAYTKILDRILYHSRILVHNWYAKFYRVAYWNKFSLPKVFPKLYGVNQLFDLLWVEKSKEDKLNHAKKINKPLKD